MLERELPATTASVVNVAVTLPCGSMQVSSSVFSRTISGSAREVVLSKQTEPSVSARPDTSRLPNGPTAAFPSSRTSSTPFSMVARMVGLYTTKESVTVTAPAGEISEESTSSVVVPPLRSTSPVTASTNTPSPGIGFHEVPDGRLRGSVKSPVGE